MSFRLIPSKIRIDCVDSERSNKADVATVAITALNAPIGPTGPAGPAGPSISQSYGEMFNIDRNITMTTNDTYVAMTGMTGINLKLISYTDNPSSLTVTNTGIYLLHITIDGSSSANNVNIKESIFVNGINNLKFEISRHYQNAGDDGSSFISGIISLTAGDIVTLRFSGNVTPVTFQTHNVTVNLIQIDS